MKIGDKVRFLSETGGGKVAGFKGNNIVLVEDEDGFQIPTPANDVVVVEDEDYSTSRVVSNKMGHAASVPKNDNAAPSSDNRSIKAKMKEDMGSQHEEDNDPSDKEVTFRKPSEERKGGNQISAYLAFVPVDIKEVTQTKFETYFVNDSNYSIQYSYLSAEGSNWSLRAHGEVEPNTKLFIEEFTREALNEMAHVAVQMLTYKLDRSFMLKNTFDAQFRIDPVKFYKLHTFQPNDFFETPALIFPIVENDRPVRPLVVDSKKLKEEMYQKKDSDGKSTAHEQAYNARYDDASHKGNPFKINHRVDEDIAVVDLHANEILESTAGMKPSDILDYQLKVFRDTLAEYANKKGQKIVFIHGKGEGVLRRAIINELTYRYKKYTYQDASFQEYGYGATQVTIK